MVLVNLIKLLIFSITLATFLIGCGSSARVINRDGTTLIVDKISSNNGGIIFRTGNEVQTIDLSTLHYIDINHDSTVIFQGESWLSCQIQYLKIEDSSTVDGWVLPTTEIVGVVQKNIYSGYLSDLTRINIAYEDDDAAAEESDSATETTEAK
jgi:hypothetical protein